MQLRASVAECAFSVYDQCSDYSLASYLMMAGTSSLAVMLSRFPTCFSQSCALDLEEPPIGFSVGLMRFWTPSAGVYDQNGKSSFSGAIFYDNACNLPLLAPSKEDLRLPLTAACVSSKILLDRFHRDNHACSLGCLSEAVRLSAVSLGLSGGI